MANSLRVAFGTNRLANIRSSHLDAPRSRRGEVPWLALALVVYAFLLAVFFVGRAGGRWAESDGAFMTAAFRSAQSAAGLGNDYPNGYAFTVLSVFLISVTGIDAATLQQVAYPVLSALLVLPAWGLFQELTGSRRATVLATLLLFSQPEFLFVIMRGSHERLLRFLMMMVLWLLVRSYRLRDRPQQFAMHVVLFYLCAYAMVATNAFFGTSFVLFCGLGLVAAWGFRGLRPGARALIGTTARRLALVAPSVMVLGFVFMFYIYPGAGNTLKFVNNLAEQTAQITLTTQETAVNPYNLVIGAWVSTPVYIVVSCGDYLLMLAAIVVLVWQAWRWFRDANYFRTNGRWLQWLFCGCFGIQGVMSVAADRAGVQGFGNLEYRAFPSFAMLAAPLVATALTDWSPPRIGRWLGSAVLGVLVGLALLKATNEPALSNVWTAYGTDELQGMRWLDEHLRTSSAWIGPDGRLREAYDTAIGVVDTPYGNHNRWETGDARGVQSRIFLVSDTIRLQSSRFGVPLPAIVADNLVFDSGTARIYREPPQTPFQA